MTSEKKAGHCSKCDAPCFEISYMPELKIGAPFPSTRKTTLILVDGRQMDITLCEDCLESIQPSDFPVIWRRVVNGWIGEHGPEHPWPRSQINNGIMGIRHSKPWGDA